MSAWPRMVVPGVFAALAIGAFVPRAPHPHAASPNGLSPARDTAVFAGGCFWGVEAVFARVKGVTSAVSGYAGGHTVNPTDMDVYADTTGHAESVRVIYDPAVVSYEQLLAIFFTIAHNPTELNFQGPDSGIQYRSAVFFHSAAQEHATRAFIDSLNRAAVFPRPIVTEVTPLKAFYRAGDAMQRYYDRHPDEPYVVINEKPKVELLRKRYPALYVNR